MRKLISFITAIFFFFPPIANAHLEGGEDKVVGDYLIDFGYEPETIEAGQGTSLLFNLANADGQEAVDFSHIWLRITSDDEIVFSGRLLGEGEGIGTTVHMTFPKPGTYTLSTRFYEGDEELANTDFSVEVLGTGKNNQLYIILLIAFIVIASMALIVLEKKK